MERSRSPKDFALLIALFIGLSAVIAWWSDERRPALEAKPAPTPSSSPQALAKTGAVPARITWESSYEKGLERARQEGKPLLVSFYSDTCGYCKKLDAEVYTDKTVRAASADFVTVKVNGDQRPDLTGAFGIYGYPFIAFLKAEKGKPGVQPIFAIPGFVEAPTFAQAMRDAKSGKTGTQNSAKNNPKPA